ncbi:MAG: Gfo/Idh/MocA family oxidoreductase [Anaerolineales bacterium]|nr:Gfo/Idh/MocA family oxidoreductase [Anaerolineales bacterium]MCB0016591.1 Gfo/Idh/MocA family oxidoreductase [Anaerolineales bacterium]
MIGWGVLGNATIARLAVVPAIERAGNGFLAAVGSRSGARAAALAQASGATAYDNYDAVLADPAVDIVYIPLPNHLHKPWTLKALAAGKHVLVEKPFALNATEARVMAAAAEAANRVLAEAAMWRYHPRSRRIRALVQAGELGTIHSLRAAFTFLAQPAPENQRLFVAAMGGGSLWDVGTYAVGLARWILDEEPVAVTAQAQWHSEGVDLSLVGTLRFGSGALATIESGFTTALQQTYTILGTAGAIEFAEHDAFIPGQGPAGFQLRGPAAPAGETIRLPGADQYQLMVEHMGAVIQGQQTLAIPPADSVRQMMVLDALRAAAQNEQTIWL